MSAERDNLTNRLKRHATNGSGGIVIASAPGAGCTTLLRKTSDQIFSEAVETIPIYFSIEPTDENATDVAKRFAHSFLVQFVAFRRRDANLAHSAIGLAEIARLSVSEDVAWTDRAIERMVQKGDGTAFLERCLSIPLLASAGVRLFIIFDGLHNLLNIESGEQLFAAIKGAVSNYDFSFVLAGRRRFVSAIGGFERLHLDRMSVISAAELAEAIAVNNAANIGDASRDLMAVQTSRRPAFIEAIIRRSGDVSNFPGVERAYTEELFAGVIGRYFDRLFDSAVTRDVQPKLVSLLAGSIEAGSKLVPVSSWQKALSMDANEFKTMLEILNVAEVIRVTSNRVQTMVEDIALCDYINIRHRLETSGEERAAVYAASLAASIRRAPQLMAAHYRANSAIGLRDLLAKFDGREVPVALLDHSVFKERYLGLSGAEISTNIANDTEIIKLPAVVFAAHTEAFYPSIAPSLERERSAVAVGFQAGTYTPEDEIYWLAAEIDSKLEATSELTEFWCDRLETAAMACGFKNYRFWLIAPIGFDSDAVDVLVQRNAYGSSRAQADLLSEFLGQEKPAEIAGIEYEIVIPMGGETELIAAHALEEIAKRHGFKSHDINQIKTALVEACINAAEHSHSPDGRTNLKFTVRPDSLNITVANRGLRLTDAKQPAADSTRRGWGLKLIEKLMDEVRIEQTDDGTSISMTKLLGS